MIYDNNKKEKNIIVAHCYGCIHTIQLLKYLHSSNRLGEVGGVIFMALGGNAPSGGAVRFISKLPAVILGKDPGCINYLFING